ncbi:hypothetical protein LEM8419_01975 [Neolewinella maritima]|uniref:Uncharacterized protein n=1 Tax=Neolewinella maritima TaxID=1383882 RepID=A0ABN8F9D9_9BACT|nr:hypothetical protein LEM8419_01975 [Neolewinella maritima]
MERCMKRDYPQYSFTQYLSHTDSRMRYHGCQAVRHDDHIHVQTSR